MLAGRVSRRTTWRCRSISSAASSIVTMRSLSEMKLDSTLSIVVLPAPVPPETMTFRRQATAACRKSSIGWVSASRTTRSCAPSRSVRKRRIDSTGPSSASGGMIAFTREPSASRASTIGLDSSMRRPTALTIRSMIRIRWRSSLNTTLRQLEHAVALDVDLIEAVDEDVGNRRIAEQLFERAEAEQLVEHVGREALAFGQAERRRLGLALEHRDDQPADLRLGVLALDVGQTIEIEPVEQRLMDAALQLLVVRSAGVDRAARSASATVVMPSCAVLLSLLRRRSSRRQPAEHAARLRGRAPCSR